MTIVVYEPDAETRAALCLQLHGLGCRVAPFANARIAFLFVLSRPREVDGVLVNVGERGDGRWLTERLDLLPEALAVGIYDEVDEGGAWITPLGGGPLARRRVHGG